MAFDFHDRFDLVGDPAGPVPFISAKRNLAWPDPAINRPLISTSQPTSPDALYTIVPEPLATNGFACRCLYPANKFGTQGYYQVKVLGPNAVANLEFMWRFEPGFAVAASTGAVAGKIGPCIQWGNITVGMRNMFTWNCAGSHNANPIFTCAAQLQASGGGQLLQGISGPVIEVGRPYKMRIQAEGGPSGFSRFWIDDVSLADYEGNMPNTTAGDSHYYDFTAFPGGAGAGDAATFDRFGTHWNVHIWSGDTTAAPQMAITQAVISLP